MWGGRKGEEDREAGEKVRKRRSRDVGEGGRERRIERRGRK